MPHGNEMEQDSMVLPPMSSASLPPTPALWKNFNQRINIIRKIRKCRRRKNNPTRLNKSLVFKHG